MNKANPIASLNNSDSRSQFHSRFIKILSFSGKYTIYLVNIVAIIIGAILFGEKFLNPLNIINVIDSLTILAIVSIGMAFITYSGNLADLSIPTTMAFSGVMAVHFLPFGLVAALTSGILTGASIGLVNAIAIGKFRANPIIWTLAMAFVTKGLMRWIWENKAVYPPDQDRASQIFLNLYSMEVYGRISLILLTAIILLIIGQFVLIYTSFGKRLKLIGASYLAAKMSGINVTFMTGAVFVICGIVASIGGIYITSFGKIGAFYQGAGYDFDAITAIVVSGMALAGARGDIIGVIGGVFFIGILKNILTLLGVDTFSQLVIQGTMFITVVGLQSYSLRHSGRDNE